VEDLVHPDPAARTLTDPAGGPEPHGTVPPDTFDADTFDAGLDELVQVSASVRSTIESVVSGRPAIAWLTVAVLLAEGHLLIEDVPGVGKTTLAKALARAIDCRVGRIQFTPDLLPSDLTGVNIFRTQTHEFEFRPGPVFNNIVIGDEINRASPKTQSALLECMGEGQTTVDGASHALPRPFLVVATQNPVEMEGTYPLPEAQRDRFMARLTVGYPDTDAEMLMLDRQEASSPLDHLSPVTTGSAIVRLAGVARHVYASPAVKSYILDIVGATRRQPSLRLGASPRASLQLLQAAKASAAMEGRGYVLPDDIQRLAQPVVAHRLILATDARLAGTSAEDVVHHIVESTQVPAAPVGRR
jgi:MoxR-like ATPase